MSIDFSARVAAGAALLDETGTWADKISLPDLNLASSTACVLGQVYGDYEVGLKALGFDWDAEEAATANGFSMSMREYEKLRDEMGGPATSAEIFRPLTDEWLKLIASRLPEDADA